MALGSQVALSDDNGSDKQLSNGTFCLSIESDCLLSIVEIVLNFINVFKRSLPIFQSCT